VGVVGGEGEGECVGGGSSGVAAGWHTMMATAFLLLGECVFVIM
jgi:hypothetical protein